MTSLTDVGNFIKNTVEGGYNNTTNLLGVGGDLIQNQLPLPTDLTLGQSEYDFTQRVFPSDLGDVLGYNGHYMVININVQQNSRMSQLSQNDGPAQQIFTRLDNELSKTDALRYSI